MTYWWILTRQADVKNPSPPFSPTHVTLWRSFSSSKSTCNVPCRSGMRLEGLGTMEGSDNWISGHFGAPHIFYGGLRCLFEVTNTSRHVICMHPCKCVMCLCVYLPMCVCVCVRLCVYVCMYACRHVGVLVKHSSLFRATNEGHPRGTGRDHMRTTMI